MIALYYDPFFGFMGYEFTEPERTPLTNIEKQEYLMSIASVKNNHKRLQSIRNKLPQNKRKKQNKFLWELKMLNEGKIVNHE